MPYITHPPNALSGVPRENAFLVLDEAGLRCGGASVIEYFNETLLPERPLNYYISINALTQQAFDMLIGAVMARVLELHSYQPGIPARMYVPCKPNDLQLLQSLQAFGFHNDDAEIRMRRIMNPKDRPTPPPVGCVIAPVILETEEDYDGLLHRLNRVSLTARSIDWLMRLQQEQMFTVYGCWQDARLLGEMVLTAYGTEGRIEYLYTLPEYRNRGVAISLIGFAGDVLVRSGIHSVNAVVWRRNVAAMTLFQSMQFDSVAPIILYPGIDLG